MTGDFFFWQYDGQEHKVKTDLPVVFSADLFARRVVWRIYSLTSGKWDILFAAWLLGVCMLPLWAVCMDGGCAGRPSMAWRDAS